MSKPPSPSGPFSSLALPKALESDPRVSAVRAGLEASARPLWSGGKLAVPRGRWTPALAAALQSAQREGNLVRGLELVEKVLEREAHGTALVDARSATQRGSRVSRLLLLSNDGTERFYRQVERLLAVQGPRLLAICLDADSTQLAAVVPDASGVVRLLMLQHKELVAGALLGLYAEP